MMTRSTARSLGLALALVAAIGAARVVAGPDGTPRPIKGNAESLVTGVLPDGALVLESVGHATHLGRFTKLEFLYIDYPAIGGTAVFTAANGDQIFADYVGAFTTPTTAVGVYGITGGTGRFADASGTMHFAASAQDLNSVISLEFAGTIAY